MRKYFHATLPLCGFFLILAGCGPRPDGSQSNEQPKENSNKQSSETEAAEWKYDPKNPFKLSAEQLQQQEVWRKRLAGKWSWSPQGLKLLSASDRNFKLMSLDGVTLEFEDEVLVYRKDKTTSKHSYFVFEQDGITRLGVCEKVLGSYTLPKSEFFKLEVMSDAKVLLISQLNPGGVQTGFSAAKLPILAGRFQKSE